jgi:WhiB family transcriptional regulator, redox-sensing transcriptional regulator
MSNARSGRVGAVIAELSTKLAFDADDRAWMLEAKCLDADPEAFFPEKGGSTREAKRICAACPVREECLDYALSNDERFGIWGGLSERERRRAKRLTA